ncbi:MAG: substrate-binding domain-containing protein, partial [Caldilineaceae bacterium]|nr:substrate-binding domain-containing protein [Caldilineaceae bacterium]
EATEHLIKLGHRRIGLITTPDSHDVGRQRRTGYEQALRAHGLRVTRSLIRTGGLPKERGGYNAAVELLALRPRPTAILAVNNVRTIGMLQAVKEAGLRVPDDISLIGFDDSPWLSLLTPPMTTVGQPVYEIGAEATRLLIRRVTGELDSPPSTVVLPPTLFVRESTAPPRSV